MKLRDLAGQLQCSIEGDGDLDIRRVAGIEHAQPGDITFVDNALYAPFLATTRASAVILSPDRTLPISRGGSALTVLRSEHPYLTFARAMALFAPAALAQKGVDPLCAVAADAALGADVSIGPFVTIGAGASIGARTTIHPHVAAGAGAPICEDCIPVPQVSI